MSTEGPGLVEQLQSDAMNDSVSVTVLLRKAKAAAVKLKQTELAEWIEHEMSGYPPDGEVPEYRILPTSMKFFNPVRGWCPIVGADSRVPFGGSMAQITSLLASDGDTFVSSVPPEMVQHFCNEIGFNVDVKRQIGRASVAAIVEAVRNAIHDWALKLEQAGIRGEGISFSPREAEKAKSVVVNIGSIGNATGIGVFGDNATISARQTIDIKQLAQDVLKLVSETERSLANSALPSAVQSEAAACLASLQSTASSKAPDENRLRTGLTSLRTIMEGATGNLIASGVLAMIASILGN